jgi:hypothetical protein
MRGLKSLLLLLALAGLLMSGCASSEQGAGEAAQAVQDFYEHLNDGDYDAARALYNAEARDVLLDPNTASEDAYSAWAKLETKEGKIDRVEIVGEEEIPEQGTKVQYRVVYSDGSSVERSVPVTLEQGAWKIGLIG